MNRESFSFIVYMIHACANKWNMMSSEVFRVVDMYHTGIWDKERALKGVKQSRSCSPEKKGLRYFFRKSLNSFNSFFVFSESLLYSVS